MKYIALVDIKKDEELTVNYNGESDDTTSVDSWFNEHQGKKFI